MMVFFISSDGAGPVELFCQDEAHELVREGEGR